MELVTPDRLPGLEQPRVARRPAQAVAQRQAARHRRATRQQPDHRMVAPLVIDDGLGQVHQAAAFRVDRHPSVVRIAQRRVKGRIAREIRCVQLRESSAKHHARGPRWQSVVVQRAEEDDLGSSGFQELEVFGIGEMKRLVARDRNHGTVECREWFGRIESRPPARLRTAVAAAPHARS